jgi:putative nucleotidyltransferase with HDIG domain
MLPESRLSAGEVTALYEASRARERDLATACRRLRAAYEQALRYAVDLKEVYSGLQRAILQSLLSLANALEAKDPYTRGHSERVGRTACRVARALGVPDTEVRVITQAGLLHDLGKIGIPSAVLRKPGPLSPEEWESMRQHPVTGAQILAPLEFFADGALIVRHHHERMNGSGYPDGLAAEAIPIGARIIGVADVYDALTSDRPYRPKLTSEQAIGELQAQAGRTLDGEIVAIFCTLAADGCVDHAV